VSVTGPVGNVPNANRAVVPLTSVALRTIACDALAGFAETTRHPTPDGATVTSAVSGAVSGISSMHPIPPAAATTSNVPSKSERERDALIMFSPRAGWCPTRRRITTPDRACACACVPTRRPGNQPRGRRASAGNRIRGRSCNGLVYGPQRAPMIGEKRQGGSVSPGEEGEVDDLTLARARAGDELAQTAVVDRYQRRLYALVSRLMVTRPELIDDLAQESFMKVLRALPRFDPGGPARLSTWILTVATRTCLDALKAKRPAAEELPASLPAPSDPEDEVAQRQLGRRVEAAMARLPEEMRAVVVLRAYHDFDYDEIAAALGLELGTVKSRLGRARAALREALEDLP
jgi:RNA polymerase sigma-70 factor (ECF subfamily)